MGILGNIGNIFSRERPGGNDSEVDPELAERQERDALFQAKLRKLKAGYAQEHSGKYPPPSELKNLMLSARQEAGQELAEKRKKRQENTEASSTEKIGRVEVLGGTNLGDRMTSKAKPRQRVEGGHSDVYELVDGGASKVVKEETEKEMNPDEIEAFVRTVARDTGTSGKGVEVVK